MVFGISSILMFTDIYNIDSIIILSIFILIGIIALINGFSLIALRKKNIFYAISNLVYIALWTYPLYIKTQDFIPENKVIWSYILIWMTFLPALASSIFTIIFTAKEKKKNTAEKAETAKKVLSIISIVVTAAAVVLFIVSAVKLCIQIPKDIENRKQAYSDSVSMAKEMANEYKSSDLIIEEILSKHQLTYDNAEKNLYIIEDNDGISMIINTAKPSEDNKTDENTISVSSDEIGIGIANLFTIPLYSSETEAISLT